MRRDLKYDNLAILRMLLSVMLSPGRGLLRELVLQSMGRKVLIATMSFPPSIIIESLNKIMNSHNIIELILDRGSRHQRMARWRIVKLWISVASSHSNAYRLIVDRRPNSPNLFADVAGKPSSRVSSAMGKG